MIIDTEFEDHTKNIMDHDDMQLIRNLKRHFKSHSKGEKGDFD